MSSFTTTLKVEVLDQKKGGVPLARLIEGFTYDVGAEGSGESITVPAGFVTDWASVPRFFWRFEPPYGDAAKAAVVHDWLYANKGLIKNPTTGLFKQYSRADADRIFREAMGVLGVPLWKRNLLWAAVRVGGANGWGH